MTMQDYNKKAEALIRELTAFFGLEKGELAHVKVRSSINGQLIVPYIEFHSSQRLDLIIARLRSFGFPKPTIVGTRASFNDINNFKTVVSTVSTHASVVVDQDLLNKIYMSAKKWAEEKGNNRICKGVNFLRVQSSDFAKRVHTYLKASFGKDMKFKCVRDEILFYPTACPIEEKDQRDDREKLSDYLVRLITEVFKISVYNHMQNDRHAIIAFENDADKEKARELCEIYYLPSTVNGTTLIFSEPEQGRYDVPDIRILHEDYIKELADASITGPEEVQPVIPNTEDNSSNPLPNSVQVFISRIRTLVRPLDSENSSRSSSIAACDLIRDLVKALGFGEVERIGKYNGKENYINGRYVYFNEKDANRLDELVVIMSDLGYSVVRSKSSILFHSLFPHKEPNGVPVAAVSPAIVEKTKASDEPVLNDPIKASTSIKVEVPITEEVRGQIIATITDAELINMIDDRGIEVPQSAEAHQKFIAQISNVELMTELGLRGKEFQKEVMSMILKNL